MAKEEKKEGDADKAEVPPEEAAAKSKKRKLLIMIIGGVVLSAGIGVGLALFLAGGDPPAQSPAATDPTEVAADGSAPGGENAGSEAGTNAKPEAAGDAKGNAPAPADPNAPQTAAAANAAGIDFGCTHNFQPFHLNLGNPLENRYIRLEIAVEYSCSEETKAELERRLPQLRDAVIAVTSRKTREFLLGPDGKEQLRKEIHTRINHYMTKKVNDVFITDILIE